MGRNTKRQSRWNVNHKTRSGLVRWRYLGRQNRHPSSSVRVMSIGMYLQKSPGKKRCSVPRGGGLGADWHNSQGFWIAFAWNCSAICRIRNQTLVHFVSASSGTFPNCITALWLMLWLEPLILWVPQIEPWLKHFIPWTLLPVLARVRVLVRSRTVCSCRKKNTKKWRLALPCALRSHDYHVTGSANQNADMQIKTKQKKREK